MTESFHNRGGGDPNPAVETDAKKAAAQRQDVRRREHHMESEVDRNSRTIRAAMARLGACLDNGDESELVVWIVPGVLGCVHRPLRHHPVFGRDKKGRYLPPEAAALVLEWIGHLKRLGIHSIISLMHPSELKHYGQLDLGAPDLIEAYRQAGFQVRHIPWDDPAYRPGLSRATYQQELARVRNEALRRFDELPKPVVLHCSAGIDRSSPVAAFIAFSRAKTSVA